MRKMEPVRSLELCKQEQERKLVVNKQEQERKKAWEHNRQAS